MPTMHVRPITAVLLGWAVALTLAACSAPAAVTDTATPKPQETGIATGGTPTATPSGAPVGTVDTGDGYTAVFDDTHHVGVAVPSSWTDVAGQGFVDPSGNNWISVSASTSLSDYNQYWGTAGVEVAATPFTQVITQAEADTEITTLLTDLDTSYNYDGQCTPADVMQPYQDDVYTGYYSTWDACGSSTTSVLLLTAYDKAGTHKVYVNASLVSDEDKNATLEKIINSFQASFDDRAQTPRG